VAFRVTRQVLFVAGAHTEIGKTHAACGLLRAAQDEGRRVEALKPVVSGFDPAGWDDSDPGRLLAAMGRPRTAAALDAISPWRFAAPLAPPMAAEDEGRPLDLGPVADFCLERIARAPADLMIVEGVGGLMSPLTAGATSLDLLLRLACPSVLVSGSYLGAVSHTLTALEVMRSRGAPPAAILMSEDAAPDAPDFHRSLAMVLAHAGATPVIPMSRGPGYGWAGLALKVISQGIALTIPEHLHW
jgi:dethiobiotin synthetase